MEHVYEKNIFQGLGWCNTIEWQYVQLLHYYSLLVEVGVDLMANGIPVQLTNLCAHDMYAL